MWIDDVGLIDKIGQLSAACIVVTKQGRKPRDVKKLAQLEALNARTPGMPVRAFSSLTELAPKFEGKRAVVGPSSPMQDVTVPTIRTLGFRNIGRPMLTPSTPTRRRPGQGPGWPGEDLRRAPQPARRRGDGLIERSP